MVDGVVLERVRLLHDAIEAVGLRREQPPPVLGRVYREQRLQLKRHLVNLSIRTCASPVRVRRGKTAISE